MVVNEGTNILQFRINLVSTNMKHKMSKKRNATKAQSYELICRRLVWPHAPLHRRSTVRRCDGYIQVIPDLKALRLQGHGIICSLPT